MSEDRKAKVTKRKAEKARRKAEPRKVEPISGNSATYNDRSIAMEQLRENSPVPQVDRPAAMPTGASVANTAGLGSPSDNINKKIAQTVRPAAMPSGAVAESTSALPSPTAYVNQQAAKAATPGTKSASAFSDMLAPLRASAVKERTDAAKMQKYYALSDVFQALGKMGGAAIGGAIGGNILDSAPNVGEYTPSRGYLDAFEQARQANARLRALDEQEFQLAYSKKQRDEDREYQAKVRAEERAYKDKLNQLEMERQKELFDYKAKIEQATLENNLELKARYEAEAAAKTQEYWKERAAITNASDMALKRVGQESMRMQNLMYNTTPVRFSDGTTAMIPDNYYESIKESLIGDTIGGVTVTKDNVGRIIRQNPEIVNSYLKAWGISTSSDTENTEAIDPQYYSYNQQFGAYPAEASQGGISTNVDDDLNAYLAQFE